MHTSLSKKLLAGLLSLVMVLSLVAPSMGTQAASKYSLTDKKSVKSGVTFKYQLKGVSKNQYVKVTRNVSGEKVVYNKKALTKTTKVNGTGKTLNLYVTYGEKEENYTGKFTVKVYGKKTNKCYKTLVEEVNVKVPEKEEPEEPKVLVVTDVVATTEEILTVAGTGLTALTAENVKLPEGYTVKEIVTTSTSATIKVAPAMAAEVEYKVTVLDKEFTVKLEAKNDSAVTEATTFDSATEKQYMTVKVNGKTYPANANWLATEGYTVNFTQLKKNESSADELFDNGTTQSSTGLINDSIELGGSIISGDQSVTYDVQAVLMKNAEIVSSEIVKITVKDTDYVVSALSGDKWTLQTTGSKYEMNSSTLIVGEKSELSKLTGTYRGEAGCSLTRAVTNHLVTLTTSDENVLACDSTNGQIIATNAGTATITMTIGGQSLTHTFKVVDKPTKRIVSKVTPSKTNLKLFNTADYAIKLTYTDQFGDYIDADEGTDFDSIIPKYDNNDIVGLTGGQHPSGKDYIEYVAIKAKGITDDCSGTIKFQTTLDGKDITLGSLTVYSTDTARTADKVEAAKYVDGTYVVEAYDAYGYFYEYEDLGAINVPASSNKFDLSAASTTATVVGDYYFDTTVASLKGYAVAGTYAAESAITSNTVDTVTFTFVGASKFGSSIQVPLYKATASATASTDADYASKLQYLSKVTTANTRSDLLTIKSVSAKTIDKIDYKDTGIELITDCGVFDYRAKDLQTTDAVVYGIVTTAGTDEYVTLKSATKGYDVEVGGVKAGHIEIELVSGGASVVQADGRTINTTTDDKATVMIRVTGQCYNATGAADVYTVSSKLVYVDVK